MIVQPDSFIQGEPDLLEIDKTRVQSIFLFQNAVHPFRKGIVVAVANSPHTGPDAQVSQLPSIGMASVLDAAITVVNESGQVL